MRSDLVVGGLALACLNGCFLAHRGIHQPRLADVSAEADAALDLVDRAAVLADAREEVAGPKLDLASQVPAFWLNLSSLSMQAQLVRDDPEGPPGPAAPTYEHVNNAIEALLSVDQAVYSMVGGPAAALASVSLSTFEEIEPYLWSAEANGTATNGDSAQLRMNVAWVATGWLVEVRVTTSDGTYDDTLWCSGYLAEDGSVGWWDVYDDDDVSVAAEWLADQGLVEVDVTSLTWGATNSLPVDGDVLSYALTNEGGTVSYENNHTGFLSYVTVEADRSGQGVVEDYNDNERACWDQDLADVACAD